MKISNLLNQKIAKICQTLALALILNTSYLMAQTQGIIYTPSGTVTSSGNSDVSIQKNLRSVLFYFENLKTGIQSAIGGRDGAIYNSPENILELNPIGGDVKVTNNLVINKNTQTGGLFQMYNPLVAVTGFNYNRFEIVFDNSNNVDGGNNNVIFRNYKRLNGTFVWQNLDDNSNPIDMMRLENGKLRVGEMFTSKATIRINYWQDRVFENTYKLRPLTEVESFIKTNKHLPDVPSEKEVVKEGLNVGDMQATQMLKIEELTLYLIEQNKQIQRLQEENKALLKRLEALERK